MRTRIFTLLVFALWGTLVIAQPSAVIKKATTEPVIDGTIDAVWDIADKNNIDQTYTGENPTLGDAGTTWWKALWSDKGIYVLVNVTDDVFSPSYEGTSDAYKYDHPEVYFDTNFELKDGKGPQTNGSGNGNGHYQFAPNPIKDSISGGYSTPTGCNGGHFSLKVSGTNYVNEYFIPFSKLLDQDGIMVDKTGTIGFDVTVCDSDDPAGNRNRSVWSNIGTTAESWNNMDDCGTITLEGAEAGILVTQITVSGGTTITTDNGTLQMVATVEPANATNKIVKWVVENVTGSATISKDGLLTALKDGTVLVKALSTDGSSKEGKVTVTISGQAIGQNDLWNNFNLIRNWNFEGGKSGDWPNEWGGWVDTDANNNLQGQALPTIEDGAVVMVTALSKDTYSYHYQLNQSNLTGEADIPYTLKFKSWASNDQTPCDVDFEDTQANSYARYGTSTDPEAVLVNGGTSQWHYTIGTEPAWFTFHVVFDRMIETTVQKLQFMLSLSESTIYLDSVLLVKDEYLITGISKHLSTNSLKVYPNPVGKSNILTVELTSANTKVAIYNSVGQKQMEKVASGNLAKFNVASLRKGVYFIRTEDGTSQKFVK
jgi:hypothetical protein